MNTLGSEEKGAQFIGPKYFKRMGLTGGFRVSPAMRLSFKGCQLVEDLNIASFNWILRVQNVSLVTFHCFTVNKKWANDRIDATQLGRRSF